MGEITDEMRVALAKDYVMENFQSGEPWSMTIARAILAERRRCADVARSRFSGEKPRSASKSAGIEIARSILNPIDT